MLILKIDRKIDKYQFWQVMNKWFEDKPRKVVNEYYAKNKEHLQKYSRDYHIKNQEVRKEKMREYSKKRKGKN